MKTYGIKTYGIKTEDSIWHLNSHYYFTDIKLPMEVGAWKQFTKKEAQLYIKRGWNPTGQKLVIVKLI